MHYISRYVHFIIHQKKALWLNEHYFKYSSARILNILGVVHNVDQKVYKKASGQMYCID